MTGWDSQMLTALLCRRAVVGVLLLPGLAGTARAADRPNIIFIFTDDQAPGMTGFQGHPLVKTPNLDRLAREGVFFSRCYTPTPQCAPSRACVLTGRYPHATGVGTDDVALPADADTFTARLKKSGYACGIVGKWHLPYATSKAPGFGLADFVATDDENWAWDSSKVWVQGQEAVADKFLTDWHGDRAIEFVERFHEGPFFLWLCFRTPHAPLTYPPGTDNLYPPESIELPKTMSVEPNGWPSKLRGSLPVTEFARNKNNLAQDRSKYYALITRMDQNVGRLLDRLQALGLADQTVVVFASEHGCCLGDHALYGEGPFFYEELVRVPFLVRYPPLAKPGTRIDHLVGLVDLAPTFCELAGLPVPPTMHGRSLLPMVRDPQAPPRAEDCFLEYQKQGPTTYNVRGIVTRQYKLIDYLQDTDVLYDFKRDPGEVHNVINDPAYAGVIKSLQSRIDYWRRKTKDPLLLK